MTNDLNFAVAAPFVPILENTGGSTTFAEVLVDRLVRFSPERIVVHDPDAAGLERREQVVELIPSRLVPVGVEPEERDPVGSTLRD